MIVILSSVILFCLWLRLWIHWRRVRSYWERKNVPHTKPNFIMGSLTFLQRQNPTIYMKDVYQNSKSPYNGMWLFWRPALIINCPEIGRRILVKDSDNFRDRFLSSGKTDPLGSLNIFTVNFKGSSVLAAILSDVKCRCGPRCGYVKPSGRTSSLAAGTRLKDPLWSSIRRRLGVVFTSAKLRALQDLILKKSDDLIIRINREMGKGEISNSRLLFTDFTTDVIGEAAFGILSEATLTGDSIMRGITKDLMEFNLIRGLSWSSIFFFPELVDWFGLKFFPKKTTDYVSIILDKIIVQRTDLFIENEPKDLLDALLKIKKQAFLEGEEITDEIILAQALIFLIGGFDTSGSTITWTTVELAYNQQVQEKLYIELVEAKQKLSDRQFDSTTLAEMPYMNAVIKETLRKYPPMGWLDRIAAKDYAVDDNLTIPGGTPVYVNAIGMHWDPKFYPNPEKFDPDRFLPWNEANNEPYTYLPFGEGPRSCIGFRFGLQTIRYALATVISNFQVLPSPETPKPDDVEVEKRGMFLMPGEVIPLKLIPRTKILTC